MQSNLLKSVHLEALKLQCLKRFVGAEVGFERGFQRTKKQTCDRDRDGKTDFATHLISASIFVLSF